MFKTKNKLFTIPALIFSAFIFIFTSCGDLHLENLDTASIVFDFNSPAFKKALNERESSSRAALSDYIDENTYAEITISGREYYDSKTIQLKNTSKITFSDVEIGAIIQAKLVIYKKMTDSDEKDILLTGDSDWTTIKMGANLIKINLDKTNYVIYISCNPVKNELSGYKSKEDLDEMESGLGTEDQPFNYIQSAIYWIAENGQNNRNYEIRLTGYDEENTFNQAVKLYDYKEDYTCTDILTGHAAKIYFTSEDYSLPAINYSNGNNNFDFYTNVPVYFKNIYIKNSSDGTSTTNRNGLVITTDYSYTSNIHLGQNTILEGSDSLGAQHGGAVYLGTGSFTMESNSCIKNFNITYGSASEGGAVYINSGTFTMTDNSVIDNCSPNTNGGAVYIAQGTFNMEESSCINNCKTVRNAGCGGAVYINGNGYFTMTGNSSITNCSSIYNGGAVFINTNGNFFMSGGRIEGNTSETSGNGVFVAAINTKFTLSGDCYFSKDDDIYLSNNSQAEYPKIELSGNLKSDTVVFISLLDNYASLGQPVLKGDDELIKKNHSKFYINPFKPYAPLGQTSTTVEPYLKESGSIGDASTIICDTDAPVELGDVILADGNRVKPLTNSEDTNKNNIEILNLNYNYKNSVAGVIFYAGNDTDLLGNTNLMVGKQWYHDYFDQNSSPTNFDTTTQISGIEVINDDLQVDLHAKSIFSTSEFTNPSSGATYLSNQSNLIKGILQGTNTNYPLLQKVLKYGEQFGESSQYYYNTENTSKNWYIPTIAEYYILYKAFENENFVKSFNSLCTLIPSSCFVSTTRYGTANYGYLQPQKHAYVYTCNFTTDTLGIDVASNQNYALPIHTY